MLKEKINGRPNLENSHGFKIKNEIILSDEEVINKTKNCELNSVNNNNANGSECIPLIDKECDNKNKKILSSDKRHICDKDITNNVLENCDRSEENSQLNLGSKSEEDYIEINDGAEEKQTLQTSLKETDDKKNFCGELFMLSELSAFDNKDLSIKVIVAGDPGVGK